MGIWRRTTPSPGRLAAVLVATLTLAILSIAVVHTSGEAAYGAKLAARGQVNPVELLGTYPDLTGCTSAPLEVGKGNAVYCRSWGGVTTSDGLVQVVSIYADDTSVVDRWSGVLPKGLAWGNSIKDVTRILGQPQRITAVYGTPTFVYMFQGEPFGSLELRFSAGDRLAEINACLTR